MDHEHQEPPSFWRSPAGLTLLVAMAVGGFYLLAEHTAHVFGALPYLLVLACPLMHVFMHGGHGHSHGGHRHARSEEKDNERTR
jgi:hypothetical protein